MAKIFGQFVEHDYMSSAGADSEFLRINFSPTSIPIQHRWRNNGLSADFLADYVSIFFPGEDDQSLNRLAEVKGGVSYIANELLENAMKFNYNPIKHSVSIGMELQKDKVVFYVSNFINPAVSEGFQNQIQKLLTEDPNKLYIETLLENEENEATNGSGLGYLTMINDWNADLAWKFEVINEEGVKAQKITVMVQFPFAWQS